MSPKEHQFFQKYRQVYGKEITEKTYRDATFEVMRATLIKNCLLTEQQFQTELDELLDFALKALDEEVHTPPNGTSFQQIKP